MKRFSFGKNWEKYSQTIDHERIEQACKNLEQLSGTIQDKSFLDIGCGSGIHSLAALLLGASKVCAIDYDAVCIRTTSENIKKQWKKTITFASVMIYLIHE